MAQNVTLMNANYSDVPAVLLPKTGGGTARFDDASITTATASDVLSGKKFLASDGTITTGTLTGTWKKIGTAEFTVNTTSTSNQEVGFVNIPLADYNNKEIIVWVHIRDKAGKRQGYFYGGDSMFFNYSLANNTTSSVATRPLVGFNYDSTGKYVAGASGYGVYGERLYMTSSDHKIRIYSRYNSSYGTINGTYVVDVYALTMPSGLTLFT